MQDERRDTLLIILGAGASYDCLPGELDGSAIVRAEGLPDLPLDQVRPPLTQQLARARPLANWVLKDWKWAGPVVDQLRRSLDEANGAEPALTLERALKEYEDSGQRVPEVRRHMLAARFYLRDLLWAHTSYMMSSDLTGGITNYLTLVRQALEWSADGDRCVVIVSFNYDLLIEHALASCWEFYPWKLSGYLSHEKVSLLKPHGSVHWHWTLPERKEPSRTLYDHGVKSIMLAVEDDEFDRRHLECLQLGPHETQPNMGASRPLHLPALALPVDGKGDFVWPEEQAKRLSSLAGGKVTRLLTIGWRAAEDHFMDLLTPLVRRDAKALVVAGGESGAVEAPAAMARIQDATVRKAAHVPDTNWRPFGTGFSELMRSSKELRWLLDD